MLSLDKIVANLNKLVLPKGVGIKSVRDVMFEKLMEYDSLVFGTARYTFMERWINTPGSFGWAAFNKSSGDIIGYAIVKQIIRGAGTEIGLAMAPLIADDVLIAQILLKTTAESCLANEAVPNTKLELFHPVGDSCGEDSSELMDKLETEMTLIGYRMYSKGVPPGRQLKKVYGIASPTFD